MQQKSWEALEKMKENLEVLHKELDGMILEEVRRLASSRGSALLNGEAVNSHLVDSFGLISSAISSIEEALALK
jgi:hypothetical protein